MARAMRGELCLAASVVRGPALVLGARQRSGAFAVDVEPVRRASTGTEFSLGAVSIWWSLGLPRLDALFPDAQGETLLNRNVRGFLRGFNAQGVPASYLGREFIAVQGASGALLGYDVSDHGAVLLEVIAGWSHPLDVPLPQRDATTRRVPGVALETRAGGRTAAAFARGVAESVAARSGRSLLLAAAMEPMAAPPWVEPRLRGAVRVPIGVVEAGEVAGEPWFGGDALVSTSWLRRAASAVARGDALPDDAVMHGARPEDYLRAWRGESLSP